MVGCEHVTRPTGTKSRPLLECCSPRVPGARRGLDIAQGSASPQASDCPSASPDRYGGRGWVLSSHPVIWRLVAQSCCWGHVLFEGPGRVRAPLRPTSDSHPTPELASSACRARSCACSRPCGCGAAPPGKGKSAPTSTRLMLLGTSDSADEALAECCSTEQSGHDLAVGMSASGCWNRTIGPADPSATLWRVLVRSSSQLDTLTSS